MEEIRPFQKPPEAVIHKVPFSRLVQDITRNVNPEMHMQQSAIIALHTAAEAHLESIMHDTNLCASLEDKQHARAKDINLACRIRGLK